ncbi:hypothetical protein [Natronincola ferrireducens]|uniref:Uncharacterized protein n=1 Tax=Natronincola ferrireducens TaxID=393762 RepID=A0A1G8ZT69_9FIRM|nr:hypothetical protein [Natronincola ferrireducens]SDK17555.1 hypothetical protein SAMN05660472_00941 [Natronincola ferrireducens]
MFYIGLLLLLIGALMVYGTVPISRICNITTTKAMLFLKGSGLVIAIVGVIFIFFNEIPNSLEFLKIIRF